MNKTNHLASSKAFSQLISYSLRFSPSSLFQVTHIIVDVAQTIQQKKKDTLLLLAFAPIRVNSRGGILTLWLIRLRGTAHHRNKFRGIPGDYFVFLIA
jgi:hypothetical protein